MGLTPTLGSTLAVFRKLEREAYRAYHARDRIHKGDHFYNFCITAHSLRDHFLREQGISDTKLRNQCHARWNKIPVLVATSEIANSSKHFSLRKAPQTRGVRSGKSVFVDIYIDQNQKIIPKKTTAPDYFITLADGSRHDLYVSTEVVVHVWRNFLKSKGYRVRRQPFDRLHGKSQSAA